MNQSSIVARQALEIRVVGPENLPNTLPSNRTCPNHMVSHPASYPHRTDRTSDLPGCRRRSYKLVSGTDSIDFHFRSTPCRSGLSCALDTCLRCTRSDTITPNRITPYLVYSQAISNITLPIADMSSTRRPNALVSTIGRRWIRTGSTRQANSNRTDDRRATTPVAVER